MTSFSTNMYLFFSILSHLPFSHLCPSSQSSSAYHPKNNFWLKEIATSYRDNSGKEAGKRILDLYFWNWQFNSALILLTSVTSKIILWSKKREREKGNWKSIYLSINVESMSDTLVVIRSMLLFPLSDWMLIESPFFETRAYELISMASL